MRGGLRSGVLQVTTWLCMRHNFDNSLAALLIESLIRAPLLILPLRSYGRQVWQVLRCKQHLFGDAVSCLVVAHLIDAHPIASH